MQKTFYSMTVTSLICLVTAVVMRVLLIFVETTWQAFLPASCLASFILVAVLLGGFRLHYLKTLWEQTALAQCANVGFDANTIRTQVFFTFLISGLFSSTILYVEISSFGFALTVWRLLAGFATGVILASALMLLETARRVVR